MSKLFAPIQLRDLTLPHRLWMAPMCMYSSVDGHVQPFHLAHLGARALGGAALVMTEATAVEPRGRISPDDAGIWSEAHVASWKPVTALLRSLGAKSAIQLAHAGKKASTSAPFRGHGAVGVDGGGWQPVGPDATPFAPGWWSPQALTSGEITTLIEQFAAAARRSVAAGFEVVEIHAAHGYLLHQFLSPLMNSRQDEWGGDRQRRARLLLEVTAAVRAVLPDGMPLLVRISATDWVDGGWSGDDSVWLAGQLVPLGVDLLDVSSGGASPAQQIPLGPGYQVPFAQAIRSQTAMPTAAVGLLLTAEQCEEVVASGAADAVFLGRPLLRDPHLPLRFAQTLGADIRWPDQYLRSKPY